MNSVLTSRQSFAIIGAGLVGRLLAWRLAQSGHSVQLIEKSSFSTPLSAAHTAAAMISPMSEVVVSERSIYDMGVTSLSLWPQWIAELKQVTGTELHYQANGSLVVAHPADESELHQFYQDLNHHLGQCNNAKWLDKTDIHQLEPDLSGQFNQALLLPNEAYLDNRGLLDSLLTAVIRLGGKCIDNTEVQLGAPNLNPPTHVDFSSVDAIIDCRGLGSNDRLNQLRGVRGEVLWVETREVTLTRPIRLMHPRYKLYIVPKPNNRFIIGATEIESQDRSPVSVQSMLELCSALYTLNPAFAEARIHELDANLRPAFWDNLPSIDCQSIRVCKQDKPLFSVNGLYRHGYLLAPYLIQSLLQHPQFNQYHQQKSLSL